MVLSFYKTFICNVVRGVLSDDVSRMARQGFNCADHVNFYPLESGGRDAANAQR